MLLFAKLTSLPAKYPPKNPFQTSFFMELCVN